MKISELIEELETILNEKGDLDVCIKDEEIHDSKISVNVKEISVDEVSYKGKHPSLTRIKKEILLFSAETKNMMKKQLEDLKSKRS